MTNDQAKTILKLMLTENKYPLNEQEKEAIQKLCVNKKSSLKTNKKSFHEVICKSCGKTFITSHPSKIYCSDKCTNHAWWERTKADPEKHAKRIESCRIATKKRRAIKKEK